MLTVAEFVLGLGGTDKAATILDVTASSIMGWARRNRMHRRHWDKAKRAAEEHGLLFSPHNPGQLARPKHWPGQGLGRYGNPGSGRKRAANGS